MDISPPLPTSLPPPLPSSLPPPLPTSLPPPLPTSLPPPLPTSLPQLTYEQLTNLLQQQQEEIKRLKSTKKRRTKKDIEAERLSTLVRKEGDVFSVSTKQLQEHQTEFATDFIESKLRGAMAIHGVGTGKTLTAVLCSELFLRDNPNSKVIVITPASLLAGFKQELYTYDEGIEADNRYKFFTYDGYVNAVKKEKPEADCKNGLLIVDEAQNLRTPIKYTQSTRLEDGKVTVQRSFKSGAKVFRILDECALKAKKVLLLSATPIVNRIDDLENLMAMVNGHMVIDNQHLMDKLFSDGEAMKRYFGCRLSFFENSPESRAEFFPVKQEMYVPIIMNNRTLNEYEDIERGMPDEKVYQDLNVTNPESDLNSFYNGLRRNGALGGIDSQKIRFMVDWIEAVINQREDFSLGLTEDILETHTDKTIIFTHFTNSITKILTNELDKKKISYGNINGTVSKSNRAKLVREYVDGKIKVMIISKAGAEGLNLLETGYIFLTEPGWNDTEKTQVVGRGIRFKSHINLPESKRNVLVLSLFLIKPDERTEFKEYILDDKKIPLTEIPKLSIDMRLFIQVNLKQRAIVQALRELQKVDPLERCTYSSEFLDISNLFRPKREVALPPPSAFEQKFYDSKIRNYVELPRTENNDLDIDQLKIRMVDLTREIFGDNKELVQTQNAFFTPPMIAQDMIKLSGIDKATSPVVFLEPTAGSGYIVYEALKSNPNVYCNAVENLEPLRDFLNEFPRTYVFDIDNFFYLPLEIKYSVIIMNPPYSIKAGLALDRKAYDVDFVIKAWSHLAAPGILVCLISNAYEFRGMDNKRRQDMKIFGAFRNLLNENEHYIVPYNDGFTQREGSTLKEMTTNVKMRMIKIIKK